VLYYQTAHLLIYLFTVCPRLKLSELFTAAFPYLSYDWYITVINLY
jgi:hypothetical protein